MNPTPAYIKINVKPLVKSSSQPKWMERDYSFQAAPIHKYTLKVNRIMHS